MEQLLSVLMYKHHKKIKLYISDPYSILTFFIIDFEGYFIVRTDEGQPRPKYIFNNSINVELTSTFYSTEVWSITISKFSNYKFTIYQDKMLTFDKWQLITIVSMLLESLVEIKICLHCIDVHDDNIVFLSLLKPFV